MEGKRVTVFGGAGFLGRTIVYELARRGARVTVGCRDVERAKFLKTMGVVGQVTPVKADVTNAGQVARAAENADLVVSLVGILFQSGGNTFDAVQASGPGVIARAAADAGASRLVHVSAIGADAEATSNYARSKAIGEASVREAFPAATILRPSIIFGPDDSFFNKFAALAGIAPFLPLIGGGHTRFQPVFVQDVAGAAIAALENGDAAGKTYELGGPSVYTFRQLMELMMAHTQRSRPLVHVPFWLASLEAGFLELLPKPLLTRDQVELLKSDNVVSEGALGLSNLGIEATPCETVLPTYLDRFRPGGRYNRSRVPA
jgi:uncharacterized protein YbjT (DUF2867 family)